MSEAIEANAQADDRYEERLETAFGIFLRLLSLAFLGFTLATWALAVGLSASPDMRFDTMSTQMRTYVAVLAVLHPVTCVGLWTTLSWGRVVWFMAVAFQIGFLFTNPSVFDDPRLAVAFHLGCIAIYVVFQLLLYRVANKE